MASKYPQLFKDIIFENTGFSDLFDLVLTDLEVDGYIIEGSGEVTENGRVYRLSKGEAMISNNLRPNYENTDTKSDFSSMGREFYKRFKIVKNPEESTLQDKK